MTMVHFLVVPVCVFLVWCQQQLLGNHDQLICVCLKLITFDDCWSVEELFFLKDKIRKNFNILEIGPGYGRTAHAIINFFDIKSYFMIDLKLTLKLTKKYFLHKKSITLRTWFYKLLTKDGPVNLMKKMKEMKVLMMKMKKKKNLMTMMMMKKKYLI